MFDIDAGTECGRGCSPEVGVAFRIWRGPAYQVPLLLSPFVCSTYRGS